MSGLKNKVKRWQFSQTIDIVDPITGELDKKPMKTFMVNQLTIAFEKGNMILSPFDDTLYTQLTDYEVVSIGRNGQPIFTSENEHYIDALGLAFLAMTLEFKDLTKQIKERRVATLMKATPSSIVKGNISQVFHQIQDSYGYSANGVKLKPDDDLRGDRQTWIKVPQSYRSPNYIRGGSSSWGRRNGRVNRSMW